MILNFLIVALFATVILSLHSEKALAEGDCLCSQIKPVAPVLPAPFITKDLIAHYVPTNMTPTPAFQDTNGNLFMVQFGTGLGQKISEDILRGDMFRKSSLGRFTDKVEKASQTSVNLGESGGAPIKIDFQVKVVERQAVFSYRGFISSDLVYAIGENTLNWSFSHPIDKVTTVAWTNVASIGSGSSSSILSLSRSF